MGTFKVFPCMPPRKKEPPSSFPYSLFLHLLCVSQRKCLSAFSLRVFGTAYGVHAGVLFGMVMD